MLEAKTCSYIKKETLAQVFFCEFCEIVKNISFLTLCAWNIFATLLHEMGTRGPTKGNAQLTRKNDFFHISQLFNIENT